METLAIYLVIGAVFTVKTMADITWNRRGLADEAGRMLQGFPDGFKALALVVMCIGVFLFWPVEAYGTAHRWFRRNKKD